MYDSLKYAKKLEEAGVSREQAEVHIQIMTEIIETNLATKQDLKDLSAELRYEIVSRFQALSAQIIQSEQKMTIRLGGIVSVAMGLMLALEKLLS
jgi:BioD-like phosphotransacetylase family protein